MGGTHSHCVVVMMRYPEKGKVKTRLAADIGQDLALELYCSFIKDTLDVISGVESDIIMAVLPLPEGVIPGLENVPAGNIIEQMGDNLGERQICALENAFERGYEKAAVMVSDSPDLDPDLICRSFIELDANDCVIGPSKDGGYYLLGFKREGFQGNVILDIDWDSGDVASTIIGNMEKAGLNCSILPPWPDVDSIEDLKDLERRAVENKTAPNVLRVLNTHEGEITDDNE